MKLSDYLDKVERPFAFQICTEKEFQYFSRITSQVDGTKCVFLSNRRYIGQLDQSVSMVITKPQIAPELNDAYGVCAADDPRGTYFEFLNASELANRPAGTPTKIGKGCRIGKYSIIPEENVVIGDDVCIEDYVKIGQNVMIGSGTHIQSGAQIGMQDFNLYTYNGRTKQVYHGGRTVIGENVFISANVLIGQALYHYDETRIGDDCQIGGGVMIGHNSKIGNDIRISAGAVITGYVTIGDGSSVAVGVYVKNGTTIGTGTTINMGSVVIRDVPDGETVFGNPARRIIAPR